MPRKVVQDKRWFPFGRRSRKWLGSAILVIVAGYVFASIGPWDSFWSLTVAPILLGAGYFVLIPIALLIGEAPPRET